MYSRDKSSDSAKYNNIIVIKRSTICAILAIDYISIIKNQEKDDDDSSVLSSVDSGEEGDGFLFDAIARFQKRYLVLPRVE